MEKEYFKYRNLEKKYKDKANTILDELVSDVKNSKDIEIKLGCECIKPDLYYDKILRQVRCNNCNKGIFDTNYFHNGVELTESTTLEALEESIPNIRKEKMGLSVELYDKNSESIGSCNIAITEYYQGIPKGSVLDNKPYIIIHTKLDFIDESCYVGIEVEDDITLSELKKLAYKIGLVNGERISKIVITEFLNA